MHERVSRDVSADMQNSLKEKRKRFNDIFMFNRGCSNNFFYITRINNRYEYELRNL